MSDIQKLAYYQREVAKMAAFTSTATRLAGCVDPALLKAGVIGSQLQATGMINPSLARFIAEQNSIMQKFYPGMAAQLYANTYKFAAVTKAASSFTKTMELANRLAQDWEEAPLLRGECAEISVEDARAVVEEVKPYMPEMAVTTIDEKLAKTKTADVKIPWDKIKETILFIVAIWSLLLQLKPDPQTEIQAEMHELQKQETERSEEFRQRTEEHFKIVEDAQERIVQAVEMFVDQLIEADNESDGVAKAIDSQDVLENCDALQQQADH